jgi:anti-anti-sigma regulatory factor
VLEAIRAAPYPVTTLVFDAESVTDLDTSGAQALAALITELHQDGIDFVLARSRTTFEQQLRTTGYPDLIPAQNRFATVRAAVNAVTGIDLAGTP